MSESVFFEIKKIMSINYKFTALWQKNVLNRTSYLCPSWCPVWQIPGGQCYRNHCVTIQTLFDEIVPQMRCWLQGCGKNPAFYYSLKFESLTPPRTWPVVALFPNTALIITPQLPESQIVHVIVVQWMNKPFFSLILKVLAVVQLPMLLGMLTRKNNTVGTWYHCAFEKHSSWCRHNMFPIFFKSYFSMFRNKKNPTAFFFFLQIFLKFKFSLALKCGNSPKRFANKKVC